VKKAKLLEVKVCLVVKLEGRWSKAAQGVFGKKPFRGEYLAKARTLLLLTYLE
jgi:hypothetical protein